MSVLLAPLARWTTLVDLVAPWGLAPSPFVAQHFPVTDLVIGLPLEGGVGANPGGPCSVLQARPLYCPRGSTGAGLGEATSLGPDGSGESGVLEFGGYQFRCPLLSVLVPMCSQESDLGMFGLLEWRIDLLWRPLPW